MAEVSAHLVDHVFPEVPVRQWVLSLPHRVRYLLARHPDLCREVRGIFARAVHSFYVRRARSEGHGSGRCGSVVQIQRHDSAIRLDVHLHGLFLDGVYTGFDSRGLRRRPSPRCCLRFQKAKYLAQGDVEWMVRHIQALVFGHLRRRGFLDDEAALIGECEDACSELATHQAAAVQGLIPFGQRAGQRATLFGEDPEVVSPRLGKKLCADHEGYSLHSGDVRRRAVRVGTGTGSRERLERLARYVTRPPFAQDRLSVTRDGSIVYRFRKPWRNGKLAVVMDPMTFLSRLAAQVPPPRSHVLSYFGVLSAGASRRDEIVPGSARDDEEGQHQCPAATGALADDNKVKRQHPERMLWSELVQRVFLSEILRCPCGGQRTVVAMIFKPSSIARILRHLGLPLEPQPRAPPRPRQAELPFDR